MIGSDPTCRLYCNCLLKLFPDPTLTILPCFSLRNSINYIAETDRVYFAVADKAMNTRIIFAFLEKIRVRYAGENGSSFNAVLGEQMVRILTYD